MTQRVIRSVEQVGVWLVAILGAGLLVVSGALAQPEILGVRMGEDDDRTRFVLDMTEGVHAKVFGLSGPDRLVIDLPSSAWSVPTTSATDGVGLIKGYRFGQFDPQTSRLVLDLKGPVRIKEQFTLPPGSGYQHRLVIDLVKAPAGADPISQRIAQVGGKSAQAQHAENVPRPLPKPRRLTLTIVIDPGHGGKDPGKTGALGTVEKDLVLDISKKLKANLRKMGYRVVLTRTSDTYPTLRERVQLARIAKADLFISLHANSNPSASVSGASVYTLAEEASDEEAAALAQLENRSDVIAGVDLSEEPDDVNQIIIELSMRQAINESSRFAELLLPELKANTKLLKNPHRFGDFRVLKAPDVPSVLVEMGHLSNPKEEKWLNKSANQDRMAKALSRAVDRYFFREERADLR